MLRIGLEYKLGNPLLQNIGGSGPPPPGDLTVELSAAPSGPYREPADITITAEVTGSEGNVESVEFFVNDVWQFTSTSAPFEFLMNDVEEGEYVITASAEDTEGATGESDPLDLEVLAPLVGPQITLTEPSGPFVAPASILLQATATDADGTVELVEFYRDGVKIGEDDTSPYEYTDQDVAVGEYEYTAKATDNDGLENTSNPVDVEVTSPPAFPNYLSFTGTPFPSSITNHPVAWPSTLSANDRLILQFVLSGTATITTPSGWTLISSSTNTGMRVGIYQKTAAGDEAGTFIVNTSAGTIATAVIHRIEAGTYDPATDIQVVVATGNSAAPDPASITANWGELDTLFIATYLSLYPGAVSVWPFPNGQDEENSGVTSGFNQIASCWSKQNETTVNPDAFSKANSARWITHTIAVKPA